MRGLTAWAGRIARWARAVRVVAYALRWKRYRKGLKPQWPIPISSDEYRLAGFELVKNIQRHHFAAEIEAELIEMSGSSPMYQFSSFIGEDRLMGVGRDWIILSRLMLKPFVQLYYRTRILWCRHMSDGFTRRSACMRDSGLAQLLYPA